MRDLTLEVAAALYEQIVRPVLFRRSAQDAHERMHLALRLGDEMRPLHPLIAALHGALVPRTPVTTGGVTLPTPLILAAGLVKGSGFESEAHALDTVAQGQNIIPGWRVIPRLVGPVEFGSFTRQPRLGNSGTVVWRDVTTRSTQNRIGLRNPGTHAAAAFLAAHRRDLPPHFGINLAVSPGVDDPDQQTHEIVEALDAFTARGVLPSWFTLNLSCPNTEDDPTGNQGADLARQLGGALIAHLERIAPRAGRTVPLWVKIGPDLAPAQYAALVEALTSIGVRAVVATNTLGQPTPDDPALSAGIGGGSLHCHTLNAVRALSEAIRDQDAPLDIVACGGVMDGPSYRAFLDAGAKAAQYWSALVYRGPLAAAVILREAERLSAGRA